MNIAIIGTGIAGTGIAHLLHPHHNITVYEKNDYTGGHSRTIMVNTPDGAVPVDTGFIVFNERNYPLLTRLFAHLQVPTTKTDMSFGVDIDQGWLEYGTYHKLAGLFAQKRNLLRPDFISMLRDILRFNKQAKAYLDAGTSLTLGELIQEMRLGQWFQDYYLLAMGAAIWSTPLQDMPAFPAETFLRFFDNHGLLTIADHPQWYTVSGGSREYVNRITAPFKHRIKNHCGAVQVIRQATHVDVIDTHGITTAYDQVVFACHSDQAVSLLGNPTPIEQEVLGSIRYQPNTMVLHSDTSFMPRRKKAWASWVYQGSRQQHGNGSLSLSYWMNNLQPLVTGQTILVTLNPGRAPQSDLIHDHYDFEHPVFDAAAVAAQARIPEIQGTDRIWFCGAWQRYGFHEDGLLSAIQVAERMGITPVWM